MIHCSQLFLLLVGVPLVLCKNPGIPGLVFDDFDQLYTHPLADGDQPLKNVEPDKDFKEFKAKQPLEDSANKTTHIAKFINDIDMKIIVFIQKKTAEIYQYKEEAGREIQKISTTFRREGCLKEVKTRYKSVMEQKVKDGSTSCKKDLEGKLAHYDQEFEGLVATCLALQPLKVKQKFMRIYAEIYINLEKISACATDKNANEAYTCVNKMIDEIKSKLAKVEKLIEIFKGKVDKYKRLAPKCCSLLKHYLTHPEKNSYCLNNN
uniref:Hypothetical secreted protein n=1 Tax=Simulium guianense TaxID=445764 RepID=F5GTM2_SIMGU